MMTLDEFNIIDIVVIKVNDFKVQNRPIHNCSNKVWQLLYQTEKTVIMSKFFSKICLCKDNYVLKSNAFCTLFMNSFFVQRSEI